MIPVWTTFVDHLGPPCFFSATVVKDKPERPSALQPTESQDAAILFFSKPFRRGVAKIKFQSGGAKKIQNFFFTVAKDAAILFFSLNPGHKITQIFSLDIMSGQPNFWPDIIHTKNSFDSPLQPSCLSLLPGKAKNGELRSRNNKLK